MVRTVDLDLLAEMLQLSLGSSAPHPSDPQPQNLTTKREKTDISTLLCADILCRFGFDLSLDSKKSCILKGRFLVPFESILVPSESSVDFSGSIGVYPDAPGPATAAAAGGLAPRPWCPVGERQQREQRPRHAHSFVIEQGRADIARR
jgi:hypothetical protein